MPIKLSPIRTKPEDSIKAKFCDRHKEFSNRYFCSGSRKLEDISAAPLTDRHLIGNVVFSLPIAVIISESEFLDDIDSFTMTLESIIRQPGINPKNVYVFSENNTSLIVELSELFNFQFIKLNSSISSIPKSNGKFNENFGVVSKNIRNAKSCDEKYKKMRKVIKMLERKERYIIVLISGLILSPDFLFFMSQLVGVADTDRSIIGISAWNPNGYKAVSSDLRLIYRSEDWPSIGFLARSDICEEFCKINIDHICWNSYHVPGKTAIRNHILYPDVSRVLWRPYPALITHNYNDYKYNIITNDRTTNTVPSVVLYNTDMLVNSSYFRHLTDLVNNSIPLNFSHHEIDACNPSNSFPRQLIEKFEKKIFVIYYKEIENRSQKTLKRLVSCFGIYVHNEFHLDGSYYGVFRFTLDSNQVFLIDSESYFRNSLKSIYG